MHMRLVSDMFFDRMIVLSATLASGEHPLAEKELDRIMENLWVANSRSAVLQKIKEVGESLQTGPLAQYPYLIDLVRWALSDEESRIRNLASKFVLQNFQEGEQYTSSLTEDPMMVEDEHRDQESMDVGEIRRKRKMSFSDVQDEEPPEKRQKFTSSSEMETEDEGVTRAMSSCSLQTPVCADSMSEDSSGC